MEYSRSISEIINTETNLRDAPFASDLRNVYNLIPCN